MINSQEIQVWRLGGQTRQEQAETSSKQGKQGNYLGTGETSMSSTGRVGKWQRESNSWGKKSYQIKHGIGKIFLVMRQKMKAGWLTNRKQCTWLKTNHVSRKAWWWQHHAVGVFDSSRPLKGCGGNTSRKDHQSLENNLITLHRPWECRRKLHRNCSKTASGCWEEAMSMPRSQSKWEFLAGFKNRCSCPIPQTTWQSSICLARMNGDKVSNCAWMWLRHVDTGASTK